jgi:hypothetical protein
MGVESWEIGVALENKFPSREGWRGATGWVKTWLPPESKTKCKYHLHNSEKLVKLYKASITCTIYSHYNQMRYPRPIQVENRLILNIELE